MERLVEPLRTFSAPPPFSAPAILTSVRAALLAGRKVKPESRGAFSPLVRNTQCEAVAMMSSPAQKAVQMVRVRDS